MSRITQSARMRSCSLRLPDCRNNPETVIFAHAPSTESGRGFKSPDWWGAYACAHCHDIVDGRKSQAMCPDWLIQERWLGAIFETQLILHQEGLLTVA